MSRTTTRRRPPSASPARASSPSQSATRPSRASLAELPKLLTVDEVADLLRTTRKAVYALIHRGTLPGVIRLSRRLLIDATILLQWLHEKRAVSLTTQGNQR